MASDSPASFEIGSFAASAKFPALRFADFAAFQEYLETARDTLDARFAYEGSLAAREGSVVREGTCAPCLRPAVFTSAVAGGEALKDGRLLPNWREAMLCDCRDRLSNRQRALLHFVQAGGILPWTRLLLLGAPGAVDLRLAALAGKLTVMRPFGSVPRGEGFHLAVSHDYLQAVQDLDAALSGMRERLLEGGRFVFTVPFHHGNARSELAPPGLYAELAAPGHVLGWDLLDRLRAAGFRDAAAYLYWSEELGYLGAMNFVFRAIR
jgi:hypothetical protein